MAKKDLNKAPNSKLLRTITASGNANANSKATVDIDISLLDENPDNAAVFNMNDIDRLARTIKEEGFAGAIEVYKKDDGRYEISAGHRRVRAVKQLGWKTIPAIVTSYPEDDVVRRTALLSSNINNRELTPMDFARAIDYHTQTLRMKYGLDYNKNNNIRPKKYKSGTTLTKELEDYFKIKHSQLANYKALMKLIPPLQKMVDARTIPWMAICPAASLSEDKQYKIEKELKQEIDAINKISREENTDETTISSYTIKRILDNYGNTNKEKHVPQEKNDKQDDELVYTDLNNLISKDDNTDSFFYKPIESLSDEDNSKKTETQSFNTRFDNFFTLIDSFSALDVSLIDKKRRSELKKKLQDIIKKL